MASHKNERAVYLLNAKVHMVPGDAPVQSLTDVLATLERLYTQQRAFAGLNDNDGIADETIGLTAEEAQKTDADLSDVIYIADLRRDDELGRTTFLVTRGDGSISSPAFVNRMDRAVRVAKPKRDEAPGHSCHVVIAHAVHNGSGHHRATVEKVPNVSRTLVTRFLNALLRSDAERTGVTFNRSGKLPSRPIKCRPRIDFALQPSANLEKDIADGRVNSVVLMSRYEEFGGLDEGVRIKRSKRQLALTVDYRDQPTTLSSWLKRTLPRYAKEHRYDEVQIHISGLEGKRSAGPTFALEEVEAAETMYARTAVISGFERPLEQCEQACNDEVVAKMVDVMGEDTNWSA